MTPPKHVLRTQSGTALLVVCLAAIVVASATVAIDGLLQPVAAAPDAQEESPCIVNMGKHVDPMSVALGQSVDVTLTARVVCPGDTAPMHVVLVLQASGSMAGAPTQEMKQAAAWLVRGLDLDQHSHVKAGVVEFHTTARTLSSLSNEERRVVGAINRVGAGGGTSIDAGIQEGIRVMRQGRGNEKDITEIMVVLSDGRNDAGCNPVLQEARQARGQGILLIAVCVGSGCDDQCMRQVASSPRYFFRAENTGALRERMSEIRDRNKRDPEVAIEVRDTVTDTMGIVGGSAAPQPASRGTDWLRWITDPPLPREGITFTFKVLPSEPGDFNISRESWGKLTDEEGRTKEWSFPDRSISVRPAATPVTPTETPTPTPTTPVDPPVHVALVVDGSGAMAGSHTQSMKQTAAGLVRSMDLDEHPSDKVGVVEFNTTARTLLEPNNDERRVVGAINRVGAAGGARIDAGLLEAARMLRVARGDRQDIIEILFLMSPGRNDAGDAPVLQAARQIRGMGILVATVCVGDQCNEDLMDQVASGPRYFFVMPGQLQELLQLIPGIRDPAGRDPATQVFLPLVWR